MNDKLQTIIYFSQKLVSIAVKYTRSTHIEDLLLQIKGQFGGWSLLFSSQTFLLEL